MSVLKITSENYKEEVLNSEKPVLIDFYADWCGPCRMMSPIIDEIAVQLGEKVKDLKGLATLRICGVIDVKWLLSILK